MSKKIVAYLFECSQLNVIEQIKIDEDREWAGETEKNRSSKLKDGNM